MKTRAHERPERRPSVLGRWKTVLAACALSAMVACTSPTEPREFRGDTLSGNEGPELERASVQPRSDEEPLSGWGAFPGDDEKPRW